MYCPPSNSNGVTGVVRSLPDLRPLTVSVCTGPVRRPARCTVTSSRFIGRSHRGSVYSFERPTMTHHPFDRTTYL